jgi:hypothetical protein
VLCSALLCIVLHCPASALFSIVLHCPHCLPCALASSGLHCPALTVLHVLCSTFVYIVQHSLSYMCSFRHWSALSSTVCMFTVQHCHPLSPMCSNQHWSALSCNHHPACALFCIVLHCPALYCMFSVLHCPVMTNKRYNVEPKHIHHSCFKQVIFVVIVTQFLIKTVFYFFEVLITVVTCTSSTCRCFWIVLGPPTGKRTDFLHSLAQTP